MQVAVGTKKDIEDALAEINAESKLPRASMACRQCGMMEVGYDTAPDKVVCLNCGRVDKAGDRAATTHVARAKERKDGKYEVRADWMHLRVTDAKGKAANKRSKLDKALAKLAVEEEEK